MSMSYDILETVAKQDMSLDQRADLLLSLYGDLEWEYAIDGVETYSDEWDAKIKEQIKSDILKSLE